MWRVNCKEWKLKPIATQTKEVKLGENLMEQTPQNPHFNNQKEEEEPGREQTETRSKTLGRCRQVKKKHVRFVARSISAESVWKAGL